MKKKIIFALLPAVLLFSILEVGLRLSPLSEYLSRDYRLGSRFDHCVFWKPAPPERNPLGIYYDYKKQFRGIYYDKKKAEGVFRIICLGGSSTWGWPLPDTKRIYPALLEELLNSHFPDRRFEVINAGVGGYSSFQDLMYLKNSLLEYSPDVVTICAGANDSNNNSDIHVAMTDREYWEYLQKKINKQPLVGQVILSAWERFFMNFRVYNAMSEIMFRMGNKPKRRVPVSDFTDNMEELIRLGRQNNFKVFFITEAHRERDVIAEYNEVLQRLAGSREGVFFVDTRLLLDDDSYFIGQMHPTYDGHKIIAAAVFDALVASGAID
jgi:lysophospholipase L1-like esterase